MSSQLGHPRWPGPKIRKRYAWIWFWNLAIKVLKKDMEEHLLPWVIGMLPSTTLRQRKYQGPLDLTEERERVWSLKGR